MSSGDDREQEADVLVLGASFAGIEVVYQLARGKKGPGLRTVVVDRQPRHGYLPLVHERLCRRIEPERSVLDTRAYVEGLPHASFEEDEVVAFDPGEHVVHLASGRALRARFVVVALGSALEPPSRLPGHDELVTHKLTAGYEAGSRTLERVCRANHPGRVLVVGGGLTGVELAGELAHLQRQRPDGWSAPEVTLACREARLLPALSPRAGRQAERHLREQGVEVALQTEVTSLHHRGAVMRSLEPGGSDRIQVACEAAFWCGGISPAPVLGKLGLPTTPQGWLAVGPTLQCFPTPTPTDAEVFACGDAVRILGGEGPWPTMQRAIECLWQARVVARNIEILAGEAPGYPRGVPPVQPHRLRKDFPHGVSLGARSLIVYGNMVVDRPRLGIWFRRFLMGKYFDRYHV